MDVVSVGPLPVGSLLWQPRASTWALTVVCKATYTLAPEQSPLAQRQLPIVEQDEHQGGDRAASVRVPSDLAPMKLAADVVLVGHAFAPGGAPVRSLATRLVVGEIDKSIEVFCDRAWNIDGALQEGARFSSMPLVWERAAGGPGTQNPVGVRSDVRDAYGRVAVPNLQPPGALLTRREDVIEPVCFGPISPEWPSRLGKLRGHTWAKSLSALAMRALPDDLDRAFFNVAPADQRTAELRADERIALVHLHPQHPRLVTSLAPVRPRAALVRENGASQEIALRCDTLVIDTDRQLCTLTWRAAIGLSHVSEGGRVKVAAETPERPLTLEEILGEDLRRVSVARRAEAPKRGEMTLEIRDESERAPAMPFAFAAPAAPPAAPPRPAAPSPDVAAAWAPPLVAAPVVTGMIAPVPAPPLVAPPPAAQTIGDRLAGRDLPHDVDAEEISIEAVPDEEGPRDVVVLVWYEKKSVPRIERKPAWQPILDDLEQEAVDPEEEASQLSDAPADVDQRTHVHAILDRGAGVDLRGLRDSVARAAAKRRRLVPPLELVSGELSLPFDELETLKATVSAVTPLASGDEALTAALSVAKDFLASPGATSAPVTAEGITARIREIYRQGKRPLSPESLGAQVERALLEGRHYQRRKVLGGSHLRALLEMGGGSAVIVYLPVEVADDLPLMGRFRARLIAEAHVGVDEREASPVAVRAVALARTVDL